MLKRLVHLLLCGMALVQLGAVPPCLLDESAAAVWADADGAAAVRSAPEHFGPRIWHDEDEGDPRFAGVRAGSIEPQTGTPATSPDAIAFLTHSARFPSLIPAPSPYPTAGRFYDAGPPPDALAARNLPLLI